MDNELLLYYIVKNSGLFGKLKTSTTKISNELGVSQQTISRKLRELQKNRIITRNVSPNGVVVALTEKGDFILHQRYLLLKKIFEKKSDLNGNVKTGMGEGSYYVKIYSKRFEKTLNFKPFLGTLNLVVNPVKKKEFLAHLNPVKINSFKTKSRTYGAVYCYGVKINNLKAALLIPERARHPENIIEIIAPVNLRKRFNLKENDTIKVVK